MAGFIIILRIFCHRKKFSMQRVKLDLIDRKILTDLQADGRMTNVELAQRVGISAPPCLRRARALEEAGYTRGYHAELNPQQYGDRESSVYGQRRARRVARGGGRNIEKKKTTKKI